MIDLIKDGAYIRALSRYPLSVTAKYRKTT